jgi:hypothetical protein
MSKAMKVQQVAVTPMTYAHRMLTVGETFMATRRDARILKAIGRSVDAPSGSALDSLRLQYEKASGFSPDKRWGEKRLRQEIEALST